ncbi:MAG: sugar phosphate isomerase/epimerase [Oscillospiraceae bacterium]|nr:sugar phosphate isomerase/epimerase [Oscillospiraceae bacterium]
MKFSFTNLACPNWNLEEIAAKAAEYGYDGIELRSHSDSTCLYPNPPLSHRKYVRDVFAKHGIEICGICAYSQFASSDEKNLEQNRQILIDDIILARDLNVPVVRSFLGENPNLTNEQVIDYAAPYLNYCADFADLLGIKVAFETHDAWCGGELMKLAFSKITSKGAAVLWDVGNNYERGESVKGFFDAVGTKCAHIHMKDLYKDKDGKTKLCLMGEGEVPVKECLEALRSIDYQGYISFEWEKRWHPDIEEPEIALPQFIEYMKNL